MKASCRPGAHEPASVPLRNQGLEFSRCRRCARDLIRSNGRSWRTVPNGFRVIWPTPRTPAATGRAIVPAAASPASPPKPGRITAALELAAIGLRGIAHVLAEYLRARPAPSRRELPVWIVPAGPPLGQN